MKATDWTKWSSIAEILSAVAILITLLYLSIQTRYLAIQTQQTNSALIANSRAATMSADVTFLSTSFANADINTTLFKAQEELTDADINRLVQWLAAMARIREFAWFQYQSGVIDEVTLRSYLRPLADAIQWPSMTETWPMVSVNLDADFVAYVNALRVE
jgi:hypothetical protein